MTRWWRIDGRRYRACWCGAPPTTPVALVKVTEGRRDGETVAVHVACIRPASSS